MSERLFWGRSRRHMVPPLIPLTTYAPSSPTLVTAQQTFPLFVQILWRKKFGCPLVALTTYPASSQFRFLLCFQPDTSFYSHLNFAFNIIHWLLSQNGTTSYETDSSLCVLITQSVLESSFGLENQTRFYQTPIFSLLHIWRLTAQPVYLYILLKNRGWEWSKETNMQMQGASIWFACILIVCRVAEKHNKRTKTSWNILNSSSFVFHISNQDFRITFTLQSPFYHFYHLLGFRNWQFW